MKRFPLLLLMFLILSLYGCDKKPEVTLISLDELNLTGSNVTFNETTLRYEVSGDVSLPTLYQNYIVTWTSSQPTYFNTNGEVFQSESDNILLTLTAKVGNQTKVFDIELLKKTNVYGHDGTYQLFQQGQSKNNGYMIKDKLPTYFKYEFIISGLEVTENIIYYTNTKETVQQQFTLVKLSENRYKHPTQSMIYTYLPELEGFEVALIEGDAYEGVLLSKNKDKTHFSDEMLYQMDQSQKVLDLDVAQSDYWYTYQINFTDNGYFSLYYTLGSEYLLEINEYVITPNFVFIYGTFQDIYLRENDRLVYYADYQLLPLNGVYEEVSIRYELLSSQLGWYDSTLFTKSEALENEALDILNDTDDRYQVFSGDIYNADYQMTFVGQLGILDYRTASIFYYEKVDFEFDYIRYQLNDDLSMSISADEVDNLKLPYDDFIRELNGSYTKQNDIIYLETTVESFSNVFPFFNGHLYYKTLVLSIQIKDGFKMIEVFLEGSYYLGSIIYIDDYVDEFTTNDFIVNSSSSRVRGIKPVTLNQEYLSDATFSHHYYRVKLDPGYYLFESDQIIDVVLDDASIKAEMVFSENQRMAYLEVTLPVDFYVFIVKSNLEDFARFKVSTVEKRTIQELSIIPNQTVIIERDNPLDQIVFVDTIEQNTVYKMTITGENYPYARLSINGKSSGTSTYVSESYSIVYFNFKTADEVRIEIFGKAEVTFYEIEDDPFGSSFEIDDTFISPKFVASPVFPKEIFTYTHTEGEASFNLLYYNDRSLGIPQSGEKENYIKVSFGLEIKDSLGRVIDHPITTPGVYTIHLTNYYDYYYFYLDLTLSKDQNISIELPFNISTLYHPDYETTYSFTLSQTSYISFKMDMYEIYYLVEASSNRVLWNVYGDYIITLSPGTYYIKKNDYKFKIDYHLSIENLGQSTTIPFNDDTIYNYPSSITVTSTYPNELHRFEFKYQTYLKYQGLNFTVDGTFHPYMSVTRLKDNNWFLFNSPYYANVTNIYFVQANIPGTYSINFPLKNF